MILASFGPAQLFIILVLVLALVGGLIILIIKMAKKKSKAEMEDDKLNQLEKLNKLKESGAISEDEFNKEKRKILFE